MMESKTKICLIPITAQPPTFGLVMSIMAVQHKFDEIIICVKDDPIVIDTNAVIKMLSIVFQLPKFMVISNPQDFEEIVELPNNLPFFNVIATLSNRIYVNLALKGYETLLIPRSTGYDEGFHRLAWRQSHALESLNNRQTQIPITDYQKTAEPTAEEGDE